MRHVLGQNVGSHDEYHDDINTYGLRDSYGSRNTYGQYGKATYDYGPATYDYGEMRCCSRQHADDGEHGR